MKSVISASRRTDIPAFYMEWFMACITRGSFDVVNPFNRRIRHVPATTEDVHTIVFWSKNFGSFIAGRYGERLEEAGYHLFFNFTLNSACPAIEQRMPPLTDRLMQLAYVSQQFDVRTINWRFDPICFFSMDGGPVKNNLDDFLCIADKAAALGIQRCITSFMDFYPKVIRRTKSRPGFAFIDINMDKKIDVLTRMYRILDQRNIALQTCCEKEVIESLPHEIDIKPSSCIPNDLIMDIYGGDISMKRDSGQRIKAGCGCRESIDIGSYDLHPCYHNCLFCYANPSNERSDA